MRDGGLKQQMAGLAALLLFGVFAVCVGAVLLTGAGAYRRLTARDRAAWEAQTRSQYIATRVRQSDGAERVRVEQFGGVPALRLQEDGGYVTWVYCLEGWLMELYTSEESELSPRDGVRLMEASELSLRLEEGLLEVEVAGPDGTRERLYLSLRSGEGAER